MPRVKLGRNMANESFVKAIEKGMIDRDIPTKIELAKRMGVTRNTVTNWNNDPESISVKHLRKMVRLNILRPEDVADLIRG